MIGRKNFKLLTLLQMSSNTHNNEINIKNINNHDKQYLKISSHIVIRDTFVTLSYAFPLFTRQDYLFMRLVIVQLP